MFPVFVRCVLVICACRPDTAGILLCGDLVVRSSAAPAGCDMRTYGGGLSRDRDSDGADRGGER